MSLLQCLSTCVYYSAIVFNVYMCLLQCHCLSCVYGSVSIYMCLLQCHCLSCVYGSVSIYMCLLQCHCLSCVYDSVSIYMCLLQCHCLRVSITVPECTCFCYGGSVYVCLFCVSVNVFLLQCQCLPVSITVSVSTCVYYSVKLPSGVTASDIDIEVSSHMIVVLSVYSPLNEQQICNN